jgi:CRP-like cAMP-binding protein
VDQKLELIKQVPLFSVCDKKGLEEIGRLADEIDVPAGKVLMRQGEHADEFFVVISGTVRIERDEVIVRSLGPGSFLGEAALLDHGPRTATATTAVPSRLLVLGHRQFDQLVSEFPSIRASVLAAVARRLRAAEPDASH